MGATLSAGCATPTSVVTIAVNLNADAPVVAEPWIEYDPFANTNYVTTTDVVDAAGAEHVLSVVFRKSAPRTFEYHALVDSYIGVGAAQGGAEVSAGTIAFASNGALVAVTVTKAARVKFAGIPAAQEILVRFGSGMTMGGSGLDATISVPGAFAVAGTWQNGAACGASPTTPRPCNWPLVDGALSDGALMQGTSLCE